MPRVARNQLEVIMVPLERKRVIPQQRFPPMPRMYFELLENKDKIQKQYINQEFVPQYGDTETVFDTDGDIRLPTQTVTKPRSTRTNTVRKDPSNKTKKDAEVTDTSTTPPNDPNVLSDLVGKDTPQDKKDEDPLASFLKKSRSIGSRNHKNTPEKMAKFEADKHNALRDDTRRIPPSLNDIEDGGAFETNGIKNVSRVSKREQDSEQKLREFLFKYDLLRRSYPNEEIPKFTINSDPDYVAKTYDDILRNLSLSDNITKYKKYLMFGFMGVEGVLGNMLGFDMKGFTKQQILEMSSYEKMLIELGEKNYVPKSNWPVELRLLGMIIMNAAFFVASKMAFKATGTDVLSKLNNAATTGVNSANIQQRQKQRMNGPTINLDDIPTMESVSPPTQAKENPPQSKGEVQFVQ